MIERPDFETLLQGSAAEHGHMCAGQVIGVRMALLGLNLIGLSNPKHTPEIKQLIVYVEIDRCAADAIAYVTGVKLGRRSLKFTDYGINAATFVNMQTRQAYRIVSTEKARGLAPAYAPLIKEKSWQLIEAYKRMPLDILFDAYEVQVEIPPWEMPGPSGYKTACDACGAIVRDGKQIRLKGKNLCHFCAGKAYYRSPVPIRIEQDDKYESIG